MFLKPIMLAGLGAALLPLVLHLLSKARYRTVEWGAMMFLQGGVIRAQRSTKLKQTVLLILRMGVIATLAIALARPVLRTGAASPGEHKHIHAIILLDRSASMGFEENGRTRFADARQAAVHVLSNLQRGDEVSLILTGDPVDPGQVQPTTDLQSVAARIGALSPSDGQADIAGALEQVRELLARETNVEHELYIICDQQAVSWENVNDRFRAAWQEMRELRAASLRCFLIPIGAAEADNVAIESIRIPGPAVVVGTPALVEVQLRNHGPIPRSNLPLTILSNGKPIAETTVNLAPEATARASVRVTLDSPGSQVLSAQVVTAGLRADDRIDSAIDVLAPARVLVITGEPLAAAGYTSADLIRLALAPNESAGADGVDPAVVRIMGVDDSWGISPDRDDVIILTNTGVLSEDQTAQLEQFIYGGGALIFAPGNLTDAELTTADHYREGEGFLPASLALIPSDRAPTRLAQVEKVHPIFSFLNDDDLPLPSARIARALELEDLAADSRVLARLADRRPFMIERPYGRGRVILFTTTLGMQWNSLATTGFYLPLLQSTVRYLTGVKLPDRNLKPGQSIELSLDQEPGSLTATVTMPGGRQRRVQVIPTGQRWTLRFTDTNQPGRYIVSLREQSPFNYVVVAPGKEFDTAPLSAERWAWLEKSLDLRRVDAEKNALGAAILAERSGFELHLPLIGMTVLMALTEMGLARRWTERERSMESIQVV